VFFLELYSYCRQNTDFLSNRKALLSCLPENDREQKGAQSARARKLLVKLADFTLSSLSTANFYEGANVSESGSGGRLDIFKGRRSRSRRRRMNVFKSFAHICLALCPARTSAERKRHGGSLLLAVSLSPTLALSGAIKRLRTCL
jgi:hypothetical protein